MSDDKKWTDDLQGKAAFQAGKALLGAAAAAAELEVEGWLTELEGSLAEKQAARRVPAVPVEAVPEVAPAVAAVVAAAPRSTDPFAAAEAALARAAAARAAVGRSPRDVDREARAREELAQLKTSRGDTSAPAEADPLPLQPKARKRTL